MAVNYEVKEKIYRAVTGWPGVTAHPHRYGGMEYRLGRREIGHLHGNTLLDIPFPTRVRNELVAAGRAEAHHVLPDSGWVSFYIRREADVQQAIDLLWLSFELAARQKAKIRIE